MMTDAGTSRHGSRSEILQGVRRAVIVLQSTFGPTVLQSTLRVAGGGNRLVCSRWENFVSIARRKTEHHHRHYHCCHHYHQHCSHYLHDRGRRPIITGIVVIVWSLFWLYSLMHLQPIVVITFILIVIAPCHHGLARISWHEYNYH